MTDPAAPVRLPKDTTHFPGDDCDPPHLDMSTVAAPVGLDLDRLDALIKDGISLNESELAMAVPALLALVSRQRDAIAEWRNALDRHQALVDINAPAVLIEHACKRHAEASDALRSLLPREPK